MKSFIVQVGLLMLLAGSAAAAETSNSWLGLTVGGNFYYGPVDGFLQTPAGGNPGSSSKGRPTLKELGIDDAFFYDANVSFQWREIVFFGGYQGIGLDGDATLDSPLTSHGALFPAGDRVHSETDLNWFHVGAGWRFQLAEGRLDITPKADFALLNFDYKISDSGQSESRSYTKGAFRLGVEMRYRFNRTVSLTLDGVAAVPISNMPQIASIVGGVEFDLAKENWRVRPTVFIGGGGEWIEYKDNQSLPNHFRVDLGPFATVGIRLSF